MPTGSQDRRRREVVGGVWGSGLRLMGLSEAHMAGNWPAVNASWRAFGDWGGGVHAVFVDR